MNSPFETSFSHECFITDGNVSRFSLDITSGRWLEMGPVNAGESFIDDFLAAQPFYQTDQSMVMPNIDGTVTMPGIEPFAKLVPQSNEKVSLQRRLSALLGYEELEFMEADEEETMQICNLNESVLRLEELVHKKGMTLELNNDGIDSLRDLYQELFGLNTRTNMTSERRTSWLPGRKFSGLKSEDVEMLDERKLTQLVHEFGLEKVRELPVLKMEAIKNYL